MKQVQVQMFMGSSSRPTELDYI